MSVETVHALLGTALGAGFLVGGFIALANSWLP